MERSEREVFLDFSGTGLQLLGYGLWYVMATVLVIPAAWGAVPLYRWIVERTTFGDGTRATFEGRPGQVWALFAALAFLPFLQGFISNKMDGETARHAFFFVAWAALIPLNAALAARIIGWWAEHLRLGAKSGFVYTGSLSGLVAWNLLLFVSFFTVIGWAWAYVGMVRWICRNLVSPDAALEFRGTGWGLLWRSLLALLGSIPVVTMPWMALWITRWLVRGVVLVRDDDPMQTALLD